MNAKTFFFSLLIAGCTPGDPVIADYQGQLLEYGTEEVIQGADVKLLKPLFSGPSGSGSFETVWQGKTDQNGIFTSQRSEDIQLAYFVGDSSFFDLGTQRASWLEMDEPLQKFYLMGKSPLVLEVRDTGQVQPVSFVEIFPLSPFTENIVQVPVHSFPFHSVVFSNYPQMYSYRLHYTNGNTGELITRTELTQPKGDTTHVVFYY